MSQNEIRGVDFNFFLQVAGLSEIVKPRKEQSMIIDQFYLSEPGRVTELQGLTGLAEDEIESIVGKFRADHWRFAGKLRGEVTVYASGKVTIRHHFRKSRLWTGEVL